MQFYGSVTLDSVKIKAFKTAFPYTVPIGASFIFLGASYGFLMVSKGFSPLYPGLFTVISVFYEPAYFRRFSRVRFGNDAAWQF